MTTLEDVARHAAVSRATVSRVINNHTYVRSEVRERVLASIRTIGYVPNIAARSMVTKRTHVIGLLVPEFYDNSVDDTISFYPMVLHGISRACTHHSYSLLLSILSPEQRQQMELEGLQSGFVDGFIGTGLAHDGPTVINMLESHKPAVLIGRNPYYPDIHSVDVDHFQAAVEAVTYLISRGRRRIAFLTPQLTEVHYSRMRDGYTRALIQHGIPLNPAYVAQTSMTQHFSTARAVAQLMALPEPPDAIFTTCDDIGYYAVQSLQERGLRVPEDVALASVDDLPIARRSQPQLTTVRQPVEQLAERAVALLLDAINGEVAHGGQHLLLPTTLIQRGSA